MVSHSNEACVRGGGLFYGGSDNGGAVCCRPCLSINSEVWWAPGSSRCATCPILLGATYGRVPFPLLLMTIPCVDKLRS